jgi:arylsulfatase A
LQAKNQSKRQFLKAAAAAVLLPMAPLAQNRSPNIVLIYADDLGYGDLGVYGSSVHTPNIDRMAREGARLVQYNSASPVCSPSRAALLTGRYPTRFGVQTVLFPSDAGGLPASETTIAAMLKRQGYKTSCVGKWHLGSQTQYWPTNRGFDEFFGLLYSNDMQPLQLIHSTQVVEEPVNVDTLTPRYTEQSVKLIANSKETPFFLYLAYTMPHIPLAASQSFRGKSALGPYGDAVEEIDWSVGQVLAALRENGLDRNTLVMFSSDHGPWYQGSQGKLQGRKGETFEGGVRVPFIASFPGRIPRRLVVRGIASALDVLPTVARLCNAPLPDKPVDGVDLWPLLTGQQDLVDRELLLYFDGLHLQCARLGRWKLHVSRYNIAPWLPEVVGGRINLPLPKPELYDLEADPTESYDVASINPQIVARIRSRMEDMLQSFPEQVKKAWEDTQSIKVENTPSGALPVRAHP